MVGFNLSNLSRSFWDFKTIQEIQHLQEQWNSTGFPMFPRRLGASLGFQGFHCPPGAHHWLDHLAAAGTDVGLPGCASRCTMFGGRDNV